MAEIRQNSSNQLIFTDADVSGKNLNDLISLPSHTGILPVSGGGTGTSNGSITGTDELLFTAGGSNKNITLTPSGTGIVSTANTISTSGDIIISKNGYSTTVSSSSGDLLISSPVQKTLVLNQTVWNDINSEGVTLGVGGLTTRHDSVIWFWWYIRESF